MYTRIFPLHRVQKDGPIITSPPDHSMLFKWEEMASEYLRELPLIFKRQPRSKVRCVTATDFIHTVLIFNQAMKKCAYLFLTYLALWQVSCIYLNNKNI